MTHPTRSHLFRVLAAAVLALALLVSLRPSAEAAFYRNHVARVPETPTSAETVTIWIESDTVPGETAAVETRIGGNYVKYYGTYDDTNGPDPSNWKVVLPAQPNGTFVEYQLFNCNGSGCSNEYGHTNFNWSYTVDDGDVQWDGLKHDTFDDYYRSPFGAVPAGTDVTLRFRTVPLDVTGVDVQVYTYDPATTSTTGPVDYPMTYLEDADGGAIWTRTLTTPNNPAILYYHFEVTDRLDVDYYSDDHSGPHDNLNQGGTGAPDEDRNEGFQLTVYDPAFQTPAWLKDAVVYQVFPDRFRNGDPARDYCQPGNEELGCPVFYGDQDVLFRSPWNTEIGNPRVAGPYFNEYGTQFYGGDLAGLMEKLDYLQAAGFDTIYTTPIFSGRSNHRYDTDDYLKVDAGLGSLSDFQDLIAAMDARGMKLIVDGVFNHTSSDSEYFDRYHRYPDDDFIGACESLASPYRSWFEFSNNDIPCGTGDYTGWFGYDSLAVLQDGSTDVRDFIYAYDNNSVVETWYQRGVAGWRFDVADEISHDWWRDFRPYAKSYKADGPLVGEVWPDASAFLLGDQLDSVMNYRFRKNVLGFVRQAGFADNDNNGNNEIISLTPSQLDRALMSVREDYPPEATAAMLNLLDSHDTNRLRYLVDILGETDAQTLQRQKLAALFQYTYVGAPMVYYGDEVAIDSPSLANGGNGPEDDPYNRAPYPWSDEDGDTNVYGPADSDMLAFYSLLGSLRQNSEALRNGFFYTVLTGDTSPDPNDNTTYAFTRILLASEAVVAINPGTSSNTAVLAIEAEPGRVLEDKLTGTEYTVDSNGAVTVTLPPRTGVLLMDPTPTSLTVKKVVVGDAPADDWQFGGDQGSFTLPAAGGQTTFSPVPAGNQIIGETDLGGWVPAVSCAPGGETGNEFVVVALDEGEQATCTFTNTQCQPGTYDTGGASCVDANPGYYVPTAGATSQTECSPGTYQGNYAAALCNPADPGYYAGGYAAPAQTACATGSYQPDSGQESCLLADAGYFVDSEAAQQQTACDLGRYQPDSGKSSCLLADAGYYVDTTAATEQTACPVGTTSPAGSDSIDDCVGTAATLTITKETDPAGGAGFPFTLDPGTATFAGKWGSNGVGQGDFNAPFGIAVDGDGNVYVADTFAYRVQKFDADGNFILMWGKDVKTGSPTGYEVCLAAETCKSGVSGTGNGEFNLPHGIAVDNAGNVYVSDSFNNRIQVFDANGNYLGQWGSSGDAGGQFSNPNGVAVDGAGNVYVADSFNNRVQKFAGDGTFLLTWGYDVVDDGTTYADFEICTPSDTCWAGLGGNGDGQLNDPFGVTIYGGRVYVADTFNHRVQIFDTNGNYLDQWGSEGNGNGQFKYPFGLTADAAGNVYVADSNAFTDNTNDRIQKFDAGGGYLGQWGSEGNSDGQFNMPTGVAVAGDGDVYVTEYEGHRVQRFTQTGAMLDDGQSHPFEDLAPGTYLVSELVPDGWTLDDIDCGAATATRNGNTVSVTLAAGDAVTCTFSNMEDTPQDTTPPNTTIDSGPDDPTSVVDAIFIFSSDEANSTFQCKLDTFPYFACNDGTVSYGNLADGSHTFYVYAIDPAGNPDPTPAEYTWTIDTIGPVVTITSAPSDPSNDATPSFEFTSESGATFECRIDSDAFADCESGDTFGPLSDGEHTFEVRATDTAGNTGAADSHTWTIDTAPPDTAITSHPDALTNSDDALFNFETYDPGNSLMCSLDGATATQCTSPVAYNDLNDGGHTFTVYAVDTAANIDPSPATWTWTIDTAAPEPTIDTYPPNPSSSSSASFTFSSNETGSTFQCQIDSGGWTSCSSPQNYTGLSDGSHTFQVRATDTAGNTDSTPASYTWLIDTTIPDTTPPETTIDTHPPDPTNDRNPTFTFSSNESGSTFECKLGADDWEACSSPKSYTNIPDSDHTFQVRATDAAGNTDPTPASYHWLIDIMAPDTFITSMPPNPSNSVDAAFEFTSETGATFECRIDSDSFAPCVSGDIFGPLGNGEHTFEVRAKDAAGNVDPSPASYTWTVDTAPAGGGAIYMTALAGSISGGPTFQDNDILRWDGNAWSVWFDGGAAGLLQGKNQVHNINAFAILDEDAGDVVMAFSQNRRFVPGIISPVDGMDLVRWNGSAFSFYFDGSDVGLTQKTPEKIDGLHLLPGSASPINGGACLAYLLISTQGPGKVPGFGGGTLSFGGEDVIGFCATQLGTTTAGHWHMVLDGSAEGMPKNSTDSLSLSADGQTLYLTTRGTFHVDSANGGHSSIYAYDLTSHSFSGPLFRAADEGLTKKVDGLDVIGGLP